MPRTYIRDFTLTFLSNLSTFCNFIWQPPLVHHVNLYQRSFRQIKQKGANYYSAVTSKQGGICKQRNCRSSTPAESEFSQLESENSIVKQANSLLSKRLVNMERQCWANAQYSRRECLEVVGIPDSVQNNELEDKVLTIFKKIGSEVSPRDIEACHRLKKGNDRVIVKFSRHKGCEQIMSVKKDLKYLNMQVGLPGNCSIFINTGLCRYYRMLSSKFKRLHDLGKISNFYISSGTINKKNI